MTSLLILAVILFACWAWATWARAGAARFMRDWSYALLVTSATCMLMALGLWLR
jgi:hypothetical protein